MESKTKIIIIDHQDSFTYNLVQLLEEVGAEVEVMPYGLISFSKVENFDRIILSPGPGIPADYPKSIALIEKFKGKKPILGICMGLQLIVKYFGGNLYNLPSVNHGRQGEIYKMEESDLFNNIDFPIKVGLYHSWAMDQSKKRKELQLTARLNEGTIMAVQHSKWNIRAVQFHPESFMTEVGQQLIQNWLMN